MDVDFGICVTEQLKKNFIKTQCLQKRTMHCLKLHMKSQSFCQQQNDQQQVINANQNILQINNIVNHLNGQDISEDISLDDQLKKLFGVDKQIKIDNKEEYEKFMQYMENNYSNQFETQRIYIKDLELQVKDLQIKLDAEKEMKNEAYKNNDVLRGQLDQYQTQNKNQIKKINDLERNLKQQKFLQEQYQKIIQNLKNNLEQKNEELQQQQVNFNLKEQKLKNVINEAHDLINKLKKEKQDLYDRILKMLRDQNEKKKQNQFLNVNIEEKNLCNYPSSALSDQSGEIMYLSKELQKNKEYAQKFKDQLQQKIDEIEDQENKNKKMKKRNRQLESDNNKYKNLLDNLQKKLKDTEDNLKQQKQKNQELRNQLSADQIRIEQILFQNKLKSENDQVNMQKIDELNAQIQELKEDLKNTKNKTEKNLSASHFYQEKKQTALDQRQNIMDDLLLKNQEMDDVKQKLRQLENQNKILEKENFAQSNKLKECLQENSDLESLIKKLKNQLLNTERDKNSQIDQLKMQLDEITKKFEILQKESKVLQENLQNQKEMQDHNMKKKMELERRYSLLNAEQEKIQRKTNQTEREGKKLKFANKEITDKLIQTQEKLKNLLKDLAILDKNNSNLETENDNLKQNLIKKQNDFSDLSEDYEKEKDERKKQQQQCSEAKNLYEQEKFKNEKLQDEIKILTQQMTQMQLNSAQKEQVKVYQDKYDDVIVKMQRREEEISIIVNNNEKLKAEIQQTREEIQQIKIQLQETMSSYEKVTIELKKVQENILEIFNEAYRTHYTVQDLKEFLIEGEIGEHQPNPYNNLQNDQIPLKIIEYLKQASNIGSEILEEIESLKNSVENLKKEKDRLVDTNHEIGGKYADLLTRYDLKTQLLGKLSVKNFVLMLELERINNNEQTVQS